jgi:hypothetical protein
MGTRTPTERIKTGEIEQLLADEFGVREMLGNAGISKQVNGKHWQQHIEKVARIIVKRLEGVE